MKSFKEFIKDEYLALESIYYHDAHLFKFICEGKYEPTKDQMEKILMEEKLISEGRKKVDIVPSDDSDDDSEKKNYLQNDEEVELIKTYQADPNSPEGREALDKLVENKMGWIYSKVNQHLIKFPGQMSHKDDLVQEASLALIKAIEDFDVESGNIFNAYAKRCVNGAILNAFNPARQKSIVDGKVDDKGNVASTVSVDAQVSGSRGDWGDKDMTIGDLIPDESVKTPGDDAEEIEKEKKALLHDWISQLPEREQMAIKMYFPEEKNDQKTFEEIGKQLKMSKMGAKKLIDRIISNLKKKADEWKQSQGGSEAEA